MDRERAKNIVKDYLPDYLRSKGIDTSKNFRCLNPAHEDRNPSMSYVEKDEHGNKHYCYCHSCHAKYDIFDLIGMDYGLTNNKDIFEKAYELYNIEADNKQKTQKTQRTQKTQNLQKTQETYKAQETQVEENAKIRKYIKKTATLLPGSPGESYLQARGLSKGLMNLYNLGYDEKEDAVIVPYPGMDYCISRKLHPKDKNDRYKKPKGVSEPLFNADAIKEAAEREEPCYILEGQIDALSIIEAGGQAVAIGGCGIGKLDDYMANYKNKLPKRFFIVADNDAAGEKTALKVKDALKDVAATIVHPPKEYKDVNDFLRADRGLLVHLVEGDTWGKWEYEQSSAAAFVSDFWKDAKSKTPAIRTGFKELDAALDGGIYEGLTVLGAVSSLGKTTFCLQIADQIARDEQQDVLIFSLEMGRYELIAKSISRLSLELCKGETGNAKTARAITDPERIAKFTQAEKDLLNHATALYKDFATHIWINEGIGNVGVKEIRQAVEDHIEATGRKPLVVIDYLQILASPDPRMSDKQAVDRNTTDLRRLCREYKIPILAISSFNRDNYVSPLNMSAFKESGSVEYSSDALIGLQPQGMTSKSGDAGKAENAKTLEACKKSKTRQIELKILKNRGAATNLTISYEYTAMFNYFKETGTSH